MPTIKKQHGNTAIIIVIVIVVVALAGFLFLNKGKDYSSVNSDRENSESVGDNVMVSDQEVKVFSLNAFNFGYSQKEIRVKKGDRVRIELVSTDGFHDWVVDEFGAATTKINTGEKTVVEFTIDKVGEFEYYCSVGRHRELGMVGKLIVE